MQYTDNEAALIGGLISTYFFSACCVRIFEGCLPSRS